jgi:hypothetical protein
MTSNIDDSNNLYSTRSHQVTVEEVLEAMESINIMQNKALEDRNKIVPGSSLFEVFERHGKLDILADHGIDITKRGISSSTNNDSEQNVTRNTCGDVLNPETGLPDIDWDRHKAFDPFR